MAGDPISKSHLPALASDVPPLLRLAVDASINRAIGGVGPLKGAVAVADEHRRHAPDTEAAIARLVQTHLRLAAASGFITGLGGIAALPVTLPAGISGLYIIAARMVVGIAHLRGYDVESEEVRSAVVVVLAGSATAEAAKKLGAKAARRLVARALRRRGLRFIPGLGGPVGGAVDAAACATIARYAMKVFSGRAPALNP